MLIRCTRSDVTDYDRLSSTFGDIVADFKRIDGVLVLLA